MHNKKYVKNILPATKWSGTKWAATKWQGRKDMDPAAIKCIFDKCRKVKFADVGTGFRPGGYHSAPRSRQKFLDRYPEKWPKMYQKFEVRKSLCMSTGTGDCRDITPLIRLSMPPMSAVT